MLDAGLDESASAPLDPDAEQPEAHAAFLMGVSTIHAIRGLGTDPSCGGPMYAQSACSLEALSRAVEASTLQTHPPSVDTLCAHDGRRDILGSRCAVGRRDGATSVPTSKTRRLCGDDVMTPVTALPPYRAEAGPATSSIRSISRTGTGSDSHV